VPCMSADARRNETQTYVPCMTVDDNMTVNAVHVDDECTVNDEVACAARTTTDECTVEVNVHAVHLRCTVKRRNGIYRSRTASMVAVHVAPSMLLEFITVVGLRRQVDL